MVYCRDSRSCVTVPSPWVIKRGKFNIYYNTGVTFLSLIGAFVLAGGITAFVTCFGYVQIVTIFLMLIYIILTIPTKRLTKEFKRQTPKLTKLYNGTYAAEFVLFCAYFSFGMIGAILTYDCYEYDYAFASGMNGAAFSLGIAFVIVGSVSLSSQKKLARKYHKKLNKIAADIGGDDIISSSSSNSSSSEEWSSDYKKKRVLHNKAVQTDISLGRRGMMEMFGGGYSGGQIVVSRQDVTRPTLDGVAVEYVPQGRYMVNPPQYQGVINVNGTNIYGVPSGNTVALREQRTADNERADQNETGQGGNYI